MTLTGDTEVYLSRTDGTLSGSVSISGDAYYDGTLSAALSNLNQPDTSGITLTLRYFVPDDSSSVNSRALTGSSFSIVS